MMLSTAESIDILAAYKCAYFIMHMYTRRCAIEDKCIHTYTYTRSCTKMYIHTYIHVIIIHTQISKYVLPPPMYLPILLSTAPSSYDLHVLAALKG